MSSESNDEEEGAKAHWLRFLFRKTFLAGSIRALSTCSQQQSAGAAERPVSRATLYSQITPAFLRFCIFVGVLSTGDLNHARDQAR